MIQKIKNSSLLSKVLAIICLLLTCLKPSMFLFFIICFISGLWLQKSIRGGKTLMIILSGFVVFSLFLSIVALSDDIFSVFYYRGENAEAEKAEDKIEENSNKKDDINTANTNKENIGQEEANINKKIDDNSYDPILDKNGLTPKIKEVIKTSIDGDSFLDATYSDLTEWGGEKAVIIKMNLPSNFSANDMLKSGFTKAKSIIQSVDGKYKDDITRYEFWFLGDAVDSSGNKDQQKLLSFEYSRNAINNINWDDITIDTLMQQAENSYVHPAFNN